MLDCSTVGVADAVRVRTRGDERARQRGERKARLDGDTRALEAEARARARQGARAGATTWCWCPRARPGGRGDAELTTDWTMLESTTRSMDE